MAFVTFLPGIVAQVPPLPPVPDPGQAGNQNVIYGYLLRTADGANSDITLNYQGASSLGEVPIVFEDRTTKEAQQASFTPSSTNFDAFILTDSSGWSASVFPPVSSTFPGKWTNHTIQIAATATAFPETIEVVVRATTKPPQGTATFITEMNATATLSVFQLFQVSPVSEAPVLKPDELGLFYFELFNVAHYPESFTVSITESPPGWTAQAPGTVFVNGKNTTRVPITFIAPKRTAIYPELATFTVEFRSVSDPTFAQVTNAQATYSGIYVSLPTKVFTFFGILIFGLLIFGAVIGRRLIEEEILGKPVPPWRIPEEIVYLAQLKREDPDQFYVVRHYLMEEEYQSALLWYEHYKHATKKDRKKERKYLGATHKLERKVARLKRKEARLARKFDRRVARLDRREEKEVAAMAKPWEKRRAKRQRKLDKKVKRRTNKLEKKHEKAVQKAEKQQEKVLALETKRIEKLNKQRTKNGEEPLPLPEPQPVTIPEPEYPQREEVPADYHDDPKYQKRVAKVHASFEKKKARVLRKKEKKVAKLERKNAKRLAKLESQRPPEVQLVEAMGVIPEEEVVVEEQRPLTERILHLGTPEQRERRRAVREEKRAASAFEKEEQRKRKQAEKEAKLAAKAEAAALKAEQEAAEEAAEPEPALEGEEPKPGRKRLGALFKRKEAPAEEPVELPAEEPALEPPAEATEPQPEPIPEVPEEPPVEPIEPLPEEPAKERKKLFGFLGKKKAEEPTPEEGPVIADPEAATEAKPGLLARMRSRREERAPAEPIEPIPEPEPIARETFAAPEPPYEEPEPEPEPRPELPASVRKAQAREEKLQRRLAKKIEKEQRKAAQAEAKAAKRVAKEQGRPAPGAIPVSVRPRTELDQKLARLRAEAEKERGRAEKARAKAQSKMDKQRRKEQRKLEKARLKTEKQQAKLRTRMMKQTGEPLVPTAEPEMAAPPEPETRPVLAPRPSREARGIEKERAKVDKQAEKLRAQRQNELQRLRARVAAERAKAEEIRAKLSAKQSKESEKAEKARLKADRAADKERMRRERDLAKLRGGPK